MVSPAPQSSATPSRQTGSRSAVKVALERRYRDYSQEGPLTQALMGEALKRLRANSSTHGIPVVAMSAGTDPELPRKVLELGANAFLLKPLQLDDVAATLRRLIAEAAVLAPLDS